MPDFRNGLPQKKALTGSGSYLRCRNCQGPLKVRQNAHSYLCSHCRRVDNAVRCGKCRRAYLTDSAAWSTARCPSCGFVEKMRSATAASLDEIRGLLTSERPQAFESQAPSQPGNSTLSQFLVERGGLWARVGRRSWPFGISVAFIATGLLYCFAWASVVQNIPSCWLWPGDLFASYLAATEVVHGHLQNTYSYGLHEFPGILVALAPFASLSGLLHTSFVQILTSSPHHHVGPALIGNPVYLSPSGYYVVHPQWVVLVMPYALLLSCPVLFALDALAERFQISRQRRALLCVAEGVLMWNMVVVWGHPEDALAIAFATYALIFALDGRFVGAGWLFGVAVAFQPLVLVILPVILAVTGRRQVLALIIRSVLPVVVLVIPPLIANFSATRQILVDQPNDLDFNHATPWTALSPRLGGQGHTLIVAGGPGRLVAVAIAVGVGVWVALRWRERPELVILACAVALALRAYTESVMTDYYPWSALAVGLVVAACCSRWRFAMALAVAVTVTVFAQLQLAWLPWWTIQIAGLTALLVIAAGPKRSAWSSQSPRVARSR